MPKPLSKLTPKAQRTRQALTDAGRAIIGQEGVTGVNVMSVCQAAGVGRTSFYDYFEDVGALIEAVVADAVAGFKIRFDTLHEGQLRGLERLGACLQMVLQVGVEDPEMALVLTSLTNASHPVRNVLEAEIAEELRGAGVARDGLVHYLTITLLALTRAVALGTVDPAHLPDMVEMMMAACRPRN